VVKKLIKWAYFKYVYPDEIEKIYRLLSDERTTVLHLNSGAMNKAIIEREWIG
jgi:hypothetical protein